MKFIIGTSGFSYNHWRGIFYPQDLPQGQWLRFYSLSFPTVEINSTFYHLPPERSFLGWKKETPSGFLFSLKASRFITHIKRLKDAGEPLRNFIDRALLLEEKLGPILYQLPPSMKRDLGLLKEFIKLLPKDLKHVFEFRHNSWFSEDVFEVLKEHAIGFCIYNMPGFSSPLITTADFAYIRFHGSQALYSSCYSDEELMEWAENIRGLDVSEVYAYFNNDVGGFAVRNAQTLSKLLGIPCQGKSA